MIAWVIILPLAVIATCVFSYHRWKAEDDRSFLIGVVASVVGLALSVAAYLWFFDRSDCSGRADVSCMLNANQGVIGALAIALTAAGIWTAVLSRRSDAKRTERRINEHANLALASAAEEVHHNLIHIAIAQDPHTATTTYPPQLSFTELEHLCDHVHRKFIGDENIHQAQTILRNRDRMAIFMPSETRWKNALEDLTSNSLAFLAMVSSAHHTAVKHVMHRPGMQDFRACFQTPFAYAYKSSNHADDATELRNRAMPCLCWLDDGGLDGVRTLPQAQRFRDMGSASH